MSWQWFKSFKLPAGLRANVSQRGIAYSIGFGIIRVGTSPSGKRWFSIRVPIIGLRFFRYIDQKPRQRQQTESGHGSYSGGQHRNKETKNIRWNDLK
ncbi:DUF4236 domain-containing protein [Vibrio neonatus]|uniref:DUF4236 domain-containing protein n=1 Tax=Vibrio neonatus TaxID=278860 RepID=UPI0036F2D232